ncbi:hypothetical protein AVBRAN12654_03205 [Campylobacter sp. RM12654]|uniref:hypothetical protein n=1 Tax=Campylobacter sp. RM12654 TaxID=2735738 RepID=UPI003014E753|nr:hypothetical protein [Campylobacter sp. RM12654]
MSGLIKFLSGYLLSKSANANSFDDTIIKEYRKYGIDEINIDTINIDEIIKIFTNNPKHIIISGSAGDGKTYILRKIYTTLNGCIDGWSDNGNPAKIKTTNYTIVFIKDFSQEESKKEILNKLKTKTQNEYYFIAANDGILLDSLEECGEIGLRNEILNAIENYAQNDLFYFWHLSSLGSAFKIEKIIEVILNRFKKYEVDCPSLSDDSIFCPIHENIKELEKIKEQVVSLIKQCDYNHNFITTRKLFDLVANAILGVKKYQKNERKLQYFESCEEAINAMKNKPKLDACIYNNLFGENLNNVEDSKYKHYNYLQEFKIGYETNNTIDDFLMYGDIKNNYLYAKLLDNKYITFENFYKIKDSFFNSNNDNKEQIQNELFSSLNFFKKFLFFRKIKQNGLDFNDLSIYHHKESYENNIIFKLDKIKDENKLDIDSDIISELSSGLNRVFTGALLEASGGEIFIVKNFVKTNHKHSNELFIKISVDDLEIISKFKKDSVSSDYVPKIFLKFSSYNAELMLDLHMFEFLMRVANGMLPISFSREYYERVIGFKTKIISQINQESHFKNNKISVFKVDYSTGEDKVTNINIKSR